MKLYPYQVQGVQFLAKTRRAILADDMGLGKTIQALAAGHNLVANKILVVCPATLKGVWSREVDKWYANTGTTTITGNREQRLRTLDILSRAGSGSFDGETLITIVGYETMRIHWEQLAKCHWDLIVFDEAHRLKNRKAQVTQAAMKLCTQKWGSAVFLLTGTPILNRADELWSLLHILEPNKYKGYWSFVKEWMHTHVQTFSGGWPITQIGKPKDPEGLKRELSGIMLRRTKEEVLPDLPDVTEVMVPLDLEGVQRKAYSTMYDHAYAMIHDKEIGATTVLAQITRLRQICVSSDLLPVGVDSADESLSTEFDGNSLSGAKIDWLMELIDGTGEQKIVVFSQFAQVVKRLQKLFGPRAISFTGDTKEEERMRLVDLFQNSARESVAPPEFGVEVEADEQRAKVFIITTTAGGVGITLTSASIVVMLDELWTPALNEQAIARLVRIGQKNKVTVYRPYIAGSIEEKIIGLQRSKKALFDSVIPVSEIVTDLF